MPSKIFFPTSQESEGFFFLQTSYIQGHVRGSLQVPPGLVCRQNKGDKKIKKKTKEGGLSLQEGDLEKVQEKKKTKEGKKVAPVKARFRVSSTKKFFFGSRVNGF